MQIDFPFVLSIDICMQKLSFLVGILSLGVVLTSCEKKEDAYSLPPKGSSSTAMADMGITYEEQIFFDFETYQIVKTSKVDSWDLAFEADKESGKYVFMNGGKKVYVYNTQLTDPAEVKITNATAVPPGEWGFDAPNGDRYASGIGEWLDENGQSKKEVYIVKIETFPATYYKIVLLGVNETFYELAYGKIESTELQQITIPKDEQYNYIYFSFSNGGTVLQPDPPKSDWDIVFTRYRYIYYHLDNEPYIVNGVLINPYKTSVLMDTSASFENLTYNEHHSEADFSTERDYIGFDWKSYDFDAGVYKVHTHRVFLINTQEAYQWKFHFLSYDKGNTIFEYERIH